MGRGILRIDSCNRRDIRPDRRYADIPTDAAGQKAELLQIAKQTDIDIFKFGPQDQIKRETAINNFVNTALDGDYSKAGDFEELMEEIRKARLDLEGYAVCHCGRALNGYGFCQLCTPKPNELKD